MKRAPTNESGHITTIAEEMGETRIFFQITVTGRTFFLTQGNRPFPKDGKGMSFIHPVTLTLLKTAH